MKVGSSRRTSIGIVGAGAVVAKAHLATLLAMDRVDVAWIADIDANRAAKLATSFGVAPLPAHTALTDLPHADIVLLAAPYGARAPYYDMCSSRNSAVYVEKPIGRNRQEHLAICARFPASRLAVGLQRRALGSVAYMRQFVEHGVFGKLLAIDFCHGSSAIITSGKAFSSNIEQAGGGVIFEHAVHGFDLALFVAGADATCDYNVRTIMHKQFDVHAEGKVILKCKSDEVTLDFRVSWLSEVGEKLTFIFENATADLSLSESLLDVRSRSGTLLFRLRGDIAAPSTSFQVLHRYWVAFLEGLSDSAPNYTSALTSILTTELMEQILIQGNR